MNLRSCAISLIIFSVPTAATCGIVGYHYWWHSKYEVVEMVDYVNLPLRDDWTIEDDRLGDKNAEWEEDLVDSRPIAFSQVNHSAAVFELDCPPLKPDIDRRLFILRPSYLEVLENARADELNFLPSARMVDFVACRFDERLTAAIYLACFRGDLQVAPAAPDFVEAILNNLPAESEAAAFLVAALETAGRSWKLPLHRQEAKDRWAIRIAENASRRPPQPWQSWSKEMDRVEKFFRFLQYEFPLNSQDVPTAIARALREDESLLKQYRRLDELFARISVPKTCFSLSDLVDAGAVDTQLANERDMHRHTIAILKPAVIREVALIRNLIPQLLRAMQPVPGNIIREAIQKIRSGEIDLRPTETDGWLQHQVFALAALEVPSVGPESRKLSLSGKYKLRNLALFKIQARKSNVARERRDDQDQQSQGDILLQHQIRPRLTVEPSAAFYLRRARLYAFLESYLLKTLGEDVLEEMARPMPDSGITQSFRAELRQTKELFFGFYLLTCNDIGMRPALTDEDAVDPLLVQGHAKQWLDELTKSPYLGGDARRSSIVMTNRAVQIAKIWATLGVRLTRLNVKFVKPPSVRSWPTMDGEIQDATGTVDPEIDAIFDWQLAEAGYIRPETYVIAVPEFAEFTMDSFRIVTSEELRQQCDQHKTSDAIMAAITNELGMPSIPGITP